VTSEDVSVSPKKETPRAFSRILVANRSEIAIRVFRTCTELGIRTIGIYSKEDRFALHRYKADETYQLDESLGPIKAYLDIPGIIAIAKRTGAEAIHPGYGFMSENADLARACAEAGIVFIGPTPESLELMGDKTAARVQAQKLGIPTVPGTGALPSVDAALEAAGKIGYPVILKASFGGGGRGMRVCRSAGDLKDSLEQASREAASAFGRGDVFLEKYVESPKHIEVQVLGDTHGNVVHLFERDCSVQRRHQKVVEIAPSPSLDPKLRDALCDAAVKLAASVKYRNAGTVEFLVDKSGAYYFIEMNPRIQVEHTVTEMVTGIDIVKSQIRVAEGHELGSPEIGIKSQADVSLRGYAIQCRVTTEDPANGFIPDYGRISAYRSAAGFGIRLDAGTAFTGAVITPYYDSLLVKVTASALRYEDACHRMDRALAEWRVRGVRSNIPFLRNVVRHPRFLAGEATTSFIEDAPELLVFKERFDRATKILQFVGEVSINGNPEVKGAKRPAKLRKPVVPAYDPDRKVPEGTRDLLKKMGPEKFAQWVRKEKRLMLTDTTFRDAHQSLLATRLRTHDLLKVAPAVARDLSGLFSLEMWGGATFDVSMRFLHEDPWERLALLREQIPNILFQMLLRGANAVGYTNYPDNVVREFVKEAAKTGIDVFRIFDSLNWLPGILPAVEMVRETGTIAEAAVCYTGNIDDPKRDKYSLKYYVEMGKALEKAGATVLGIKDMSGLLRPFSARKLVKALREEIGIPIHLHTHDTPGVQAASLLFASEAGVDVVDAAFGAMSTLTSQPNLEAIVAAMAFQERDTGLDFDKLLDHTYYWEDVRSYYAPFESGMKASAADVYIHEIPGGQYSNLRPQAESMGLGDRLPELKRMYATVNEMMGDIVKVTPSSKIVGDFALFMLTNNLTPKDVMERGKELHFPESVIGYFAGDIGQPTGGFPKALQEIVLRGRKAITGRPGDSLPPVDFAVVKAEVEKKIGRAASPQDVLSYLMYPKVFVDFAAHEKSYSDVSSVPTDVFFYGLERGGETEVEIEKGKTLFIKLVAVSEPNEQGQRTLFFELNGSPREVVVADKSLAVEVKRRMKADPDNLHHLGSPMPGMVVDVKVKPGQEVKEHEKLIVLEAMKMEMTLTSPIEGVVKEVYVHQRDRVEGGDLLIVFQ
jgi:pyruvate carboxylase